jgi:hypothetical protein
VIRAAYGSSKDIWVYQSIGMTADNIYIVGKVSKKQQNLANHLSEGYAIHLSQLKLPGTCQPAQQTCLYLPKGNFGLPDNGGKFAGIRQKKQRKSAKRTISFPLAGMSSSPGGSRFRKNEPSTGTTDSQAEEASCLSSTLTGYFTSRSGSSKSK